MQQGSVPPCLSNIVSTVLEHYPFFERFAEKVRIHLIGL